jgi:hypothetical protein
VEIILTALVEVGSLWPKGNNVNLVEIILTTSLEVGSLFYRGKNGKLVEIIFPTHMRLDLFSVREITVN